ncbi:MAG TPA: D-glycerate dehydrogenase [Gaiellaceae bacterium]|jgi:glyoxylate reductase
MKVLATRRLAGPAWDELEDVDLLPPEGLTTPRPDVEALIVANETVGERELELLPNLRLVANYGVGYDRVDVDALARRGIALTNTPGVLDAATADLAFALILAARRRVVAGDRLVRAGGWEHGWSDTGELSPDVTGATLGIVGLGRIGSAVARRARGFDMRILYTKRTRLETEDGVEWRKLDDLLREADVVTLHAPRTRETEGMIDAGRLALLQDGATFVNTARGELVEEPALVRELVSGRIEAGLDVFAHEPHVPKELLDLPNVVLTPHIGSATVAARHAMTRLVVDNVLAAYAGSELVTPVRSA